MRMRDLDDQSLAELDDNASLPRRDSPAEPPRTPEEEVTLLELLDRVLDKGIVLSGDVTLSVADIDLVHVGLRVLLTSVETAQRAARETAEERDLLGRAEQ